MKLAPLVALVIVVAGSSTGCAGAHHPREGTRTDLGLSLRVPAVGPFALGATANGSLDHGALVFPASSHAGHGEDEVVGLDVKTQRRTVLARTHFSNGFINWAVGVDGWIVYVDQSHMLSDSRPEVLWRVIAVDPRTGVRKTLQTNGDRPDPFVPQARANGGYAYWTSADDKRRVQVALWRPGQASVRQVMRHAQIQADSESVGGSWMYFLAPADAAHENTTDCWRISLVDGRRERLTESHRVIFCSSDGTNVVWTNHIDIHARPVPPEGILGNPYELWVRQPGRPAHLVHRGYVSASYPFAYRGFLVWQDAANHPVLTKISDDYPTLALDGQGAVQTATADDGTLVIFRMGSRSDRAVIIDLQQVSVIRAPQRPPRS